MTSEPAVAAASAEGSFERLRRRLLNPLYFKAYLLYRLPLAAWSGLRLARLDDEGCAVRLPGGWRTRNPFGSTYFAAQTMAAEMATGAVAMALVRATAPSLAFILREIRCVFARRIQGPSTYTFADVAGMRAAIARALASGESESFVARVTASSESAPTASEFEITWSFKRRK